MGTAVVVAAAFGHHEILNILSLDICVYDPLVHLVKTEEDVIGMALAVVQNNYIVATCPIEVERMNVLIQQNAPQWNILEVPKQRRILDNCNSNEFYQHNFDSQVFVTNGWQYVFFYRVAY